MIFGHTIIKKRRLILGIGTLLIVFLAIFFFLIKTEYKTMKLRFNATPFTFVVSDTEQKQKKGLSKTENIPHDGMIFVFTTDDRYGIWMKDMYYPIDIIFLDASFSVIDTKEHVLPQTFPAIFYPKEKARYIIETEAGFIEKYGIHTGITFKK